MNRLPTPCLGHGCERGGECYRHLLGQNVRPSEVVMTKCGREGDRPLFQCVKVWSGGVTSQERRTNG
jgi:hypothetical protein